MGNFYIEELRISGTNKETRTITFSKGTNIIYGISNTGKTMILRCINWLMGAEYNKGKNVPFADITGYNIVEMDVNTSDGIITFSREIFENSNCFVVSNNSNIESGEYAIKSKSKKNKNIDDVWIKLMGIKVGSNIIKNPSSDIQSFSWRTLLKLLITQKEQISSDESVILSKTGTETVFLSSLLLLLNGPTEFEEQTEDKKTKSIRIKSIKKYISEKLVKLNKQIEKFKNMDEFEIIELSNKHMDTLEFIQNEITLITNEINLNSEIAIKTKDEIIEKEHSLKQFKSLLTQYKADIKRLTNIVEGNKIKSDGNYKYSCPVCDNDIERVPDKFNIEAASNELKNILNLYTDTSTTNDLIVNQLKVLYTKLNDVYAIIETKKKYIENNLNIQVIKLNKELNEYDNYLLTKSEVAKMNEFVLELSKDIDTLEEEEKPKTFNAKKEFNDEFVKDINKILSNILLECNFIKDNPNDKLSFHMDAFDIKFNDNELKRTKCGTGYKAYINTILILTFRKYLFDKAIHKPTIYMIDSPLLGLDETTIDNKKNVSPSMKLNLYKYFANHQEESQLIIIDNSMSLPSQINDIKNVKLIRFTKGDTPVEGCYVGLLDLED